jgi:hypothetical protein
MVALCPGISEEVEKEGDKDPWPTNKPWRQRGDG